MTYQTMLLEKSEGVAVLTINRPDKLNALNAQAKADMRSALEDVKKDGSVDVLIITGSGEKAFVAGTDIRELTELNGDSGKKLAAAGQEVFNMVENLGKPVLAAVNGYALGGGCELALACHIRIASENAKFGQPEVNLGVIPGYGGTQRLARLIGRGRAMEMILSGEPIDAQKAKDVGLVNRVVPLSDLMKVSVEMARNLSTKSQVAVRLALKAVNMTEETNLTDGLELEASLFGVCCDSEDFHEGTKAFLEKRKPVFRNT